MTTQFALRMALAAGTASLAACSMTLLPENVTPQVAPSTSVAQASARLEEVARVRAVIEAQFVASEKICYHKFFVTSCLDEAKEKRRVALAYQRAVENEAEYFKRKAAVDLRDREVAAAIKQFDADEARAAAEPAPPPRTEKTAAPVAPKASLLSRSERQAARMARHDAREAAAAPRRAAKAEAFEQREIDAQERQRKVAARQAAKAAKADKAGKPAAPSNPTTPD